MSQYLPELFEGLGGEAAEVLEGAGGLPAFLDGTADKADAAVAVVTGADRRIAGQVGVTGDAVGGLAGDGAAGAPGEGDLGGADAAAGSPAAPDDSLTGPADTAATPPPAPLGDLGPADPAGPAAPGAVGIAGADPASPAGGLPSTGDPGSGSVPAGDGTPGGPAPNPGSAETAAGNPGEAARPQDSLPTKGDPVDMATGDVVLSQVDVNLPGALPLLVERAHRSSYRTGRWFGRSWVSTLDQRLEVTAGGVFFTVPDGSVLKYPHPARDGELVWPVSGARWPLVRDARGYKLSDPQAGTVRRFEPRSGYYLSPGGEGELPVVSVTSRAGHQIVIGYGVDGAPRSVTHDSGYQLLVEVTADRVTGLALAGASTARPDVELVRYGYDKAGNLAEVISSSGVPLRFSYDPEGRLAGWHDRNGWWYRYSYDAAGRCMRGEGPGGMLSGTFTYDPVSLVTTHTDAAGAVTAYQFTADCQVAAVTDPLGNTTRSEYGSFGQLVSQTDPLGRTTRWSYDQAGNLITLTLPDGSQASATYNDQSLPVAVTEPGGARWQQQYDAAGNLAQVTGPDGAVISYAYDQRGNLAAVTDPTGAVTIVGSNPAGLAVTVTDPTGAVTRYERDGYGRVAAVTGPDGRVTRLAWTPEGQLAARTLPDATTEQFTYDGEGNLVVHRDPGGALTRFEYGYLDQLAARTNPDGTRTEFSYDHALRLTSVVHAGLTWRYGYDLAGRLVAEADYNGAVTRYARDAAGQVASRVNATGQQVSYAYDLMGNITQRHAGDAVTTFSYDAAGRLVRTQNADALIVLERDAAGRVTAETCNGRSVRSEYDAAGRAVRRVTPSGIQTRWDYDAAGRAVALTSAGHEIRFGYDQASRETLRELPGGVTLTHEWDTCGRLATQVLAGPAATGRMMQRRGYSYRDDGVLAGIDELLSGPRRLTLNPAGKVTGVTGPGWAENYSYDPAGNITTAVWPVPAAPSSAGRHRRSRDTCQEVSAAGLAGAQGPREYAGTLITRSGDVRYQHDHTGRIILRQHARPSAKADTWHYQWDAEDHLVAVTTPDGTRWRYLYDPFGRRIGKQRIGPGGQVTEHTIFTWDGLVLTEQAAFGGQEPGSSQLITWAYRPGTFTPLTQAEHWRRAPQEKVDQKFYAIVTDLIGTPAELVSPGGDLAGHQQQTLWGATYWDGAATPLRFAGQYHDPETGLHYNRHRYYDPATGRYLTPDPLGLAPAPNPHTYVPNPCIGIDPLGLLHACPLTSAGGNKRVNAISNIGARSSARSLETISRAEPGDAFSGIYDPGSGKLIAYPSVEEPAAPGAPLNAVLRHRGHIDINSDVFGDSRDSVAFTAIVRDGGISMKWTSRSVNGDNFGQIEAPAEFRPAIVDVITQLTRLPVFWRPN